MPLMRKTISRIGIPTFVTRATIKISKVISLLLLHFSLFYHTLWGVNMKKAIVTLFLSITLVLSLSISAYAAGYSKLDNLTPGQAGYVLVQTLHGTGNYVYNVSCNASSYSYSVTISYDSLSDICATANGVGLTCSLHYNAYAQVFVIAVDDRTTLGLTGTYGVIGNPDGYIYTAESVDSGTDEIVDLLSSIRRFLSNMYGYVWGTDEGIQGILGRLDGGYSSLITTMNTHLENIETALGTGVGSLGYNVQRTLNYISGPLYNTLSSIDIALNDPDESLLLAKLDEIKTAIENINISADNITVEGYDDAFLMELLISFSPYLENIDLGIQSLNTALYVDSSTPLLQKINSIQKAIGYR